MEQNNGCDFCSGDERIQEMSLMQAIEYIAFYNGHEEELKKMKAYIKSVKVENKRGNAPYPSFLPEDPDTFIRVIWSILVCMFGDYGTSPRFGWIEHYDEAMRFLDKLIGE